ncbi:nucleotidyltransferase family protein [Fodinibius sediminis]|uniref:glucose-1-phosphate thymidylyltransferase n=1 Tax=Fodinibius sediminis TaxID=1214077 RepID=A0A521B3X6_9BACT|nr:sugar phosphate nucleotidyltransferase [Fodinibius sediminis]SMO41817.1 glucose-1-phosphate thymidylyltransferase [Fodinibius sediminis]
MKNEEIKMVGLIPAAGNASRISPVPCSKEIFPIGFEEGGQSPTIKAAASHLLESFSEAGINQVYMVTRKGKWDIPQYLGVGTTPDYTLAYIFTEPTAGTHQTIDLAYRFVRNQMVLLGFPDILFKPKNAFPALLEKQKKTGADVVLGLFEAANPQKADMVDIDEQGRVKEIVIKPEQTNLTYTWIIAVWTPSFSEYLHHFVSAQKTQEGLMLQGEGSREIFIGDVIHQALRDGLKVDTVLFPDGYFLDIGTIPDLKRVWNDEFQQRSELTGREELKN